MTNLISTQAPSFIGERLLSLLCRPLEEGKKDPSATEWTDRDPLETIRRVAPQVLDGIMGKKILDYGCGYGHQAVALARMGAYVWAYDINEKDIQLTAAAAGTLGKSRTRLSASTKLPVPGSMDLVISQNSFEHFGDPARELHNMARQIHLDGRILVTFGPPWLAPKGSHMHFFTYVPWVNLLFPESVVMNVRKKYRSDGATRYVDAGLNKMTLAKFEEIIDNCGLEIVEKKYETVKGLPLGNVPHVRELFVNHVTVILRKKINA